MKSKAYQDITLIGPHVRNYLTSLNRRKANRTIDSYEETLAWMCLRFPDRDLSEITKSDLAEWIAGRWGHLKATTERQRTAAVKSFFRWAVDEEELIEKDPARGLRPPKAEDDGGREAFSPDVIDQLIEAQPKLRDRIAIQLLGDLGLRRNELRLLKLSDINVGNGRIRIRNGKGGKVRTVYTTTRLQSDLEEYLTWDAPPQDYLLGPQGKPRDHYSQTGIHYWFERCLKRAGLKILMHEMRHSAATNLLESKQGSLLAAQQLLGHTSVKTTEGYLHPDADLLKDALRART